MGPFNYLGSSGALKERYWDEWRDDVLSWLHGRFICETVLKIAIGKSEANLKEQVRPSFRPAHLLLLDHPPRNEIVDTRFGRRRGDPLLSRSP